MNRKTKKFLFMPSVAFAAAYLLWGFNTTGVKIVVSAVPIYAYLALRYGIGAAILYPIARRKWQTFKPKVFRRILLAAFLGTIVPMVCAAAGLKLTSAITASVIYLLEPVLMYILSMELLRERFSSRVFMGLAVSLMGAMLLVLEPMLGGKQLTGEFWGNVLILIAVVSSVLGAVVIKPILNNRINLNQITVTNFTFSFIVLLPFAIWQFPQLMHVNCTPSVVAALLYGILFATVLAFPIYYYGLRRLSGEEGSIFHYLDPVGGIVSAVVVLGESITTLVIFGAALVCWGIYLSEARYKFVRFPFLHAHK